MKTEALYHRMPISAQHAVCSLVGWRIQHTRFGSGFTQQLLAAEQRQRWSSDQMLVFRDRRLQNFVRHAAATVPYYRELFREHGVNPERIRTLDDMRVFPVLTKSVVQERQQHFFSSAIKPRDWRMTHTSGTTGGGLRFPTTLAAMQEQWAVWWRFRRRLGISLRTWCGYFGGRSVVPIAQTKAPYWRYNWPGRQILFSGYHLAPDTLGQYVEELNRSQPAWLHGYPSILSLLAEHLLSTGQSLKYQPKFITTGSENLQARQSAAMERAFGVRPANNYGLTEAAANVSECTHGRLHVDEDFAAVEFLPNNGGGWRVVGTNFTNPAFPLLRYDVGDVVELDERSCDCGLPGRTISAIDGRSEDYVVLRNGARIGRMDHVFKDMTAVREAQIFQNRPGVLMVRVVKNPGFSELDERHLRQEFFQRLGDQADVQFDYVPKIARTQQGKLRFVVSGLRDTPEMANSVPPAAPSDVTADADWESRELTAAIA